MKVHPFAIVLAALPFFALGSLAKDAAGSTDHPLVKRVTGSEIIWSKVAKFDEMTIALEKIEWDGEKFKDSKKEVVEGARAILYYKLPGDVSTLEAVRQYQEDLKPAGFTTLFNAANDKLDDGYNRFVDQIFPNEAKAEQLESLHQFNHNEQRYAALKGTGKNGADVYITLYAFKIGDDSVGFDKLKESHGVKNGSTVVRVDILETKAMEARMTVVKAAEIEDAISKTGRIAIYGIYFDTDKAEIKPESADSLTEMANAVKAGKGRKFLIVGHTDNQGDLSHNQGLSQKRAAAVTSALTSRYGVSPDSVVPVGVGMAAPVAPNTDDNGRAKNRRVEIVAM